MVSVGVSRNIQHRQLGLVVVLDNKQKVSMVMFIVNMFDTKLIIFPSKVQNQRHFKMAIGTGPTTSYSHQEDWKASILGWRLERIVVVAQYMLYFFPKQS